MQNILSKARSSRGYNVLELLFALLAFSSLLGLLLPVILGLEKLLESQQFRYQDEIGIYQLQIVLATNKILEIGDDTIDYQTYENECQIELVNDNLISTPGCTIFLYHVDSICFKVEKEIIYLQYYRGDQWYEYAIAYKEK